MKVGTIEIVSCHLDLITNPEKIASTQIAGAKKITVDGQFCLIIKAKRWGGPKTGNVNNCRRYRLQRKRRSAKW